jgi:hypothetical protein
MFYKMNGTVPPLGKFGLHVLSFAIEEAFDDKELNQSC